MALPDLPDYAANKVISTIVCLLIVSATRRDPIGDELTPVPRRSRNRLAPDLHPTGRPPPRLDTVTDRIASNPDRRRQALSDPCAFPVTANLTVPAPVGHLPGRALDAAGAKGESDSIASMTLWQ